MTKHPQPQTIRALFIAFFLVVTGILISAPGDIQGFPGGGGDGKFSYGGCSCHTGESQRGGGTIALWASTLQLDANQEVTVIVNVTENVLTDDMIIGVFLLRSMTGGDADRPSEDGWRIVTDPVGNQNNYVKKTSPGLGSTVTFEWVLTSPFRSGTYDLTARVHHGGNLVSWFEEGGILTFSVTGIALLDTEISMDAPSEVQVDEEFNISARLTDASANPLAGHNITFSRITTFGRITLGTHTTDGQGYALHSDTSYERGFFILEASFDGSSEYAPSNATAEIISEGEVEPEPSLIGGIPLPIVIVIIMVVASVWVAFAYVLYQLFMIRKIGKGKDQDFL
ncbi:MAG: Ig-like domain-containing protein [Thermoplasmata archaeon]